jgi:transposase-like protein
MGVDDADLLEEFLAEQAEYSADLKALVLRMVHTHSGNVSWVSQQTGVAPATIYYWLSHWNQEERTQKKRV